MTSQIKGTASTHNHYFGTVCFSHLILNDYLRDVLSNSGRNPKLRLDCLLVPTAFTGGKLFLYSKEQLSFMLIYGLIPVLKLKIPLSLL